MYRAKAFKERHKNNKHCEHTHIIITTRKKNSLLTGCTCASSALKANTGSLQ